MTTNYGERPGIEARGERWAARCQCYNGHNSASGRCNSRNVTDATPDATGPICCEWCRGNCRPVTLRPERETHPRCNCGARIPMDCGDYCDDCAADAAADDAIERAIAARHGVTL